MKGLNFWIHCTNSFTTKTEDKISKYIRHVFSVFSIFKGASGLCKPFRLLCTVHSVNYVSAATLL
jgi:hypothetical protein